MNLTVTSEATFVQDGSVVTVTGQDDEGRDWVFAGDWRPMLDLAAVVQDEGEVEVSVEPWQILAGPEGERS